MKKSQLCPCCSGKTYINCCQKYHQGSLPENALVLMRSRYSAYALSLSEYIMKTTHPQSPHFVSDKKQWAHQILAFSKQVNFDKLEILETQFLETESFVTFIAHLSKEGVDLTFTERSRFWKQGHVWQYMDGKIAKGCLTAAQMKNLA